MVREYRGAIRRIRDRGLPIDEALTTIEMARLLDPAQPDVRAAADAAREILARLGAKPFPRAAHARRPAVVAG